MENVTEINDPARLAELRPAWEGLLAATPDATFFQTLDWLEVYWRHYGLDQQLRVFVVDRGGAPVGIVPLVVRREATRLGAIRVLTYPLHDWGTFYGPIGSDAPTALAPALRHIRATARDWDLVELRWIDDDGSPAGCTAQALANAGLSARRSPWAQTAVVELTSSWDAYWANRTSHWRNNVRRSEKKLRQQGPIEHVRYRPRGSAHGDDNPRWDLYDHCIRIAQSSWQGSSTSGTTLTHAAVRAFLRDAHEAACRAGALDLNLLTIAGAPVAFNYAYHWRGRVFGLRMGFDGHREHDGAGSVLTARIIEDGFRRGDRELDMGVDYFDGKRPWLTRIATSYCYTHYPRSARAQLLRMKRWVGGRKPKAESRKRK